MQILDWDDYVTKFKYENHRRFRNPYGIELDTEAMKYADFQMLRVISVGEGRPSVPEVQYPISKMYLKDSEFWPRTRKYAEFVMDLIRLFLFCMLFYCLWKDQHAMQAGKAFTGNDVYNKLIDYVLMAWCVFATGTKTKK